jgi:hypothetical protein
MTSVNDIVEEFAVRRFANRATDIQALIQALIKKKLP